VIFQIKKNNIKSLTPFGSHFRMATTTKAKLKKKLLHLVCVIGKYKVRLVTGWNSESIRNNWINQLNMQSV